MQGTGDLPVGQVVAIVGAVLAPAFSAGAAWMAVKGSLNGARKSIERTDGTVNEIRADMKTLVASDAAQNERLGRVEERLGAHEGWIRRVEDTANEAWERRRERRE